MQCREFSSTLRAFSNMLDVAGAPVARDRIMTFAAAFDAHPTLNVSDLAKRIAVLGVTEPTGSPSLGDVARLLSALKSFLDKAAKTAVLNDVTAIEMFLRDRAAMELGAFVRIAVEAGSASRPMRRRDAPRVRDDLVAQYKQKLEAALGDEEAFTAVYNDLRANTAMGKAEITALAKQMTGSGARTQDAALKKIWTRHQSLVVFKAKSRATAGRSAA
jgi:hypothetical protein